MRAVFSLLPSLGMSDASAALSPSCYIIVRCQTASATASIILPRRTNKTRYRAKSPLRVCTDRTNHGSQGFGVVSCDDKRRRTWVESPYSSHPHRSRLRLDFQRRMVSSLRSGRAFAENDGREILKVMKIPHAGVIVELSMSQSPSCQGPTSIQIYQQYAKHPRYPAWGLQHRRLKDSMAEGAPSHRSSKAD